MNRDLEDIQRRILMLLQDSSCSASSPDVEGVSQSPGCDAIAHSSRNQFNPRSPRPMNSSTSDFSESNHSFSKESSSFELGDVPVVQDRFQALLKNRLQSEIQKNPPLFPWETELLEYPESDAAVGRETGVTEMPTPSGRIALDRGWLRHLKNLRLPVPAQFPEPVLATLLHRCQDVLQTGIQDGAKLVRVVEDLFPGQGAALQYLAGNVMMAPARSPKATTTEPPIRYDTVIPDQQMVLSLLAAREILNALSLNLSAAEAVIDRQWQTDVGVLSLHLNYQQQPVSSVRVHAILPVGGTLTVRNGELHTTAQRTTVGHLSAELFDPQSNYAYTVECQLAGMNQPLKFALRVD